MIKLNLTHFLLNTFLKECHFELQAGFYTNMVSRAILTTYIINDETYSLDKLATSWYWRQF